MEIYYEQYIMYQIHIHRSQIRDEIIYTSEKSTVFNVLVAEFVHGDKCRTITPTIAPRLGDIATVHYLIEN
jgi:hypothetical protein